MVDDEKNDFSKISTGNGIDRDLAATTNDRLEKLIVDLRNLNTTIEKSNNKNESLQNKIFWLTVIGVGLAFTQLVQVIDVVLKWLN